MANEDKTSCINDKENESDPAVEVDPEVIHLDKENELLFIIVPIALSAIVIIIGVITCRHYMNRRKKYEAQQRAEYFKDK